ncbi:MAG: FIST signal transduction protein [Actinomycetota bacterium]
MNVGAALSSNPDARGAGMEAALEARNALGDRRADLAVVFASPQFADGARALLEAVHEAAGPAALIGCIAEGVIARGHEIEDRAAVSVWLASLDARAEISTFAATWDEPSFEGLPAETEGAFLMLCDPYSFPAHLLLEMFNEKAPGATVMGGLASGSPGPGGTRLFLDDRVLDSGAVGARLSGNLEIRTLVSQGCRPIGPVLTVTRAEGNMILELGGRTPLERLKELYESLDEGDRRLVSRGLMLGRVIDEYRTDFGRGDFLVRGLLGADPETGAVAVGDNVEVGQTVQFHVRDAPSADEDLKEALASFRRALGGREPGGALLFTCNGRGTRMFDGPDHDAALVTSELGAPVAGFFCAGELGPVGGKNFLHGFTASMAVFVEQP